MIFLDTICNNVKVIERNLRLKIQQSLDYADQSGSDNLSVIALATKIISITLFAGNFLGQTMKLDCRTSVNG